MNKRIGVLVAALFVSYLSIGWLRSGAYSGIRAPDVDLSVVPMELGGWKGQDVDIQDETVRVLKANSFINRIYRDSLGQELSLHIANWKNDETITAAPHHPEMCYPGAGWQIIERRVVAFPTATGECPIELILFQKAQQRVVTGHWYRVGDVLFVADSGFQRQRYRFWGARAWPNTTKFLIQSSLPTLDAAQETITNFATIVADAVAAQNG